MAVLGLVSPGRMGAALGACARSKGHDVIWAGEGRSSATHKRAQRFRNVGSLSTLAEESDFVLCIGTGWGTRGKHWTMEVAEDICEAGFNGIYCDANTLTERDGEALKSYIESFGVSYINGALMGSPPLDPNLSCRGYINGADSSDFASLFNSPDIPKMIMEGDLQYQGNLSDFSRSREERGLLGREDLFEWVEIEGDPCVLKLAYSAYTAAAHGTLVMANRFAREYGVEKHLFYELTHGFPVNAAVDGSRMGIFAGW